MRRLLLGLLVIIIVLLCFSALALYSLQQGGYLERHISKLVEHDEYDKFGFLGVWPNWDLSFDVIKPRFSRGVIRVEADKVTILPRYSTLHTARPVAEKFIVHNARVIWPTASISGLTITGTCPQSTDKLQLKGKIQGLVTSKVLNGPGKLESSFDFEPSLLNLPDIHFQVGDEKLSAALELKPSSKDNDIKLNFDFGDSAPKFNVTSDVACRPIGSLELRASLPHEKQLQRVVATLPLSEFALEVMTKDIAATTKFERGRLHLEKEVLRVEDVSLALSNALNCSITGTISDVAKDPIYRLNVKSKQMSISELLALLPNTYSQQLGNRKLFGAIDVEGVIEGKGNPEPTARLSLAGLGCEMDVDGTKRKIVFQSGSLSLKRGRRLVLSGVDISLSGIVAKIAGNVVEHDGEWEGEGRATVRDLAFPALIPMLPSKYANTLALLSPKGLISTEVRASLAKGAKPSIKGSINLNGMSLTMPKVVGGSSIELDHATVRLNDEEAYLEPCSIKLGSAYLSAKGELHKAFTNPTIKGDIGGKDISVGLLLALLPEETRKALPIKGPKGTLSLEAKATTDESGIKYSASVDLVKMAGTLVHSDNALEFSIPKGRLELSPGRLETKHFSLKTLGHTFEPKAIILFDNKKPTLDFTLPATLIKAEQTANYLPKAVPPYIRKALLEKKLSGKAYIALQASGTFENLAFEGKATAQKISYVLSKNQPRILINKVSCKVTPNGVELDPFIVRAGKNTLQVSLDEQRKLLVLLGKRLEAKELAGLAPPQYLALSKRLAPEGALSVKAYVPLLQPAAPTIDVKLSNLSIAMPIADQKQRVAMSASLRWRNKELAIKSGLLAYGKVSLKITDGRILEERKDGYCLSLALNGDLPFSQLAELHPELVKSTKQVKPRGTLALSANANGPLSKLRAVATLTPKELGADISLANLTLSPRVTKGAFQVVAETKGDQISARASLTPPLEIEALGTKFKISGTVADLTTKPDLEASIGSTDIPLVELLARLPAELCASIAAFSPKGSIKVSGSFKGTPSNLDGLIQLTPSDFEVSVPIPGKIMKATLVDGCCKLKAYVRQEKTAVHALLSPPLKLQAADASLVIDGQIKDLLGDKVCEFSAISSPLPVSLACAMAPEEFQEKLSSLGLQGTFKVSGQMAGPLSAAKTTAALLPAGLEVSPKESPIPLTAKVLSGEIGLLSQMGEDGSTRASVAIEKAVTVQALGCESTITGKIEDLLGSQSLALNLSLQKAPLNSVVKKICKMAKLQAPALTDGIYGEPQKAVVTISGTAKEPEVSSWADLTGIGFRHPSLAKPLAITSGRVASRKAGGFLWKALKFNLGNISILSSGEFQGTLAEGSFKDAKVESAFELKELPPLLKLEKSLASNGKAQLSGTISGKLTTPEVKGTLLAPGKFSVRMTGAKKPFRIDAGDIKAKWDFSSQSGKLTIADIEGMVANGLIAGNATISLMAEKPVHECEILFADMDVDKFLRRGANIGGLLKGTFGLEFKGKLTGGLDTLEGTGLTDIYDCELNGNKLISVAGFDKYFPKKDKRHNNIGGLLLQVATEGLLNESSGGQKLLRVRDVLHHSFQFGQVSGKVNAKEGKFIITPITSKDGRSSLSGSMTIDLNKLSLDGLTSFRLVHEPDVLTITDLAIKGSISEPEFDLPQGPLNSFKFRSLTKDFTPKKPEIGSDKSNSKNSVIIER